MVPYAGFETASACKEPVKFTKSWKSGTRLATRPHTSMHRLVAQNHLGIASAMSGYHKSQEPRLGG